MDRNRWQWIGLLTVHMETKFLSVSGKQRLKDQVILINSCLETEYVRTST